MIGWGAMKAAKVAGGLVTSQGSESGPLWSLASSWAPCCAAEGAREQKRKYTPADRPPSTRPRDKTKAITSRVLMAPSHRVTAFCVDPDRDVLYTGSDVGGIVGWDLAGGVAFWSNQPPEPAPGVRAIGCNALRVCKGILSATYADGVRSQAIHRCY